VTSGRTAAVNASPGALVVIGAISVAVVAAFVGLGLLFREPSFLPVLMIGAALAVFLIAKPDWIVPVFIAVTWAALPGRLFGGLPSPVEAGGALLLLYAAYLALTHREVARNALVVMALLGIPLIASALVSPEGTAVPAGDLRELLFLFIAAMCVTGLGSAERVAVALVFAALILGLGGVWSILVGPTDLFPLIEDGPEVLPSAREAPRAGGPFGEPNFYALSLAAVTPLALHLVAIGGWYRLLGGSALAAIAGGILAAGSRGAAGAMLFALVAVAIVASNRQLRLGAVATVLVAAALVPLFGSQAESSANRSVGGRATENQVALAMMGDHPVAGVGPDRYDDLYRDYSRHIGDDPRPVREAHSLPLEIAAEQGIVGILGWLIAGGVVLAYSLSRGIWRHALGRALLISVATYLVGSLFLHGSQLRLLFMLVGVTLAYAASLGEARTAIPRAAQ
jgi:O-antigen ligase